MTPKRRRAWIAWGLICVIWGTTYLGMKVALETMPPFLIGGMRYTLAGGVLLALLLVRRTPLPPRDVWPRFFAAGALLLGVGNGGVIWSQQWVGTGVAAVLVATTPLWMTSLEAALPGGERLTLRTIAGLLVGLAGIVLLVWADIAEPAAGSRFAAGVIGLQIACVGWSLGTSYSRRRIPSADPLVAAAFQMLFGGLVMTTMALLAGEPGRLAFSLRSTIALVYLSLIGGVVAFAAYAYALKYLPVSTLSLYGYVNPIIAVLLGVWLLGEPFTPRTAVAVIVILTGMAIVSYAKPGTPDAPAARPTATPDEARPATSLRASA